MRYRKRNGKKSKEEPISSVQPTVPPSNSVGQTPIEALNAALVREETKRKLTKPEDQTIFRDREAGFDAKQIAGAYGWSVSWVLERLSHIDDVITMVVGEVENPS
jgi:hypothetical protein